MLDRKADSSRDKSPSDDKFSSPISESAFAQLFWVEQRFSAAIRV
jgi:hypothetical protein